MDKDVCKNCINYYGNAENYGTCTEHEDIVDPDHEACSWFILDTNKTLSNAVKEE